MTAKFDKDKILKFIEQHKEASVNQTTKASLNREIHKIFEKEKPEEILKKLNVITEKAENDIFFKTKKEFNDLIEEKNLHEILKRFRNKGLYQSVLKDEEFLNAQKCRYRHK